MHSGKSSVDLQECPAIVHRHFKTPALRNANSVFKVTYLLHLSQYDIAFPLNGMIL